MCSWFLRNSSLGIFRLNTNENNVIRLKIIINCIYYIAIHNLENTQKKSIIIVCKILLDDYDSKDNRYFFKDIVNNLAFLALNELTCIIKLIAIILYFN